MLNINEANNRTRWRFMIVDTSIIRLISAQVQNISANTS